MAYQKQTWNSGVSGGTPISATALNHMETGIANAAVLADLPVAVLRQTTAQQLPGVGYFSVIWQVADIDTHSGWSATTNQTRWTVPTGQGGIYRVNGIVALSISGNQWVYSRLMKNGAIVPGSPGTGGDTGSTGGGSSMCEYLLNLVPNDYVELQGYSDQATTFNTRVTTADGVSSSLRIERIR